MRRTCLVALVVVGLNFGTVAQSCSDCSFPTSPDPWSSFSTGEHTNGFHTWREVPVGSCTYSGGSASYYSTVACGVDAEASTVFDNSNSYDTGTLTTSIRHHAGSFAQISGSATANNGGGATAGTEGAYAVQSCTINCSTTITFSGSGSAGPINGGVTVSYSPAPLWTDKHNYTNTCSGVTLAQLQGSGCPYPTSQPPYTSQTGGQYVWNTSSCNWVWQSGTSPIVIDTANTGFAFTDPAKGQYVTFDIMGNGQPLKLSWPAANSGNAWLVYDRDGDGVIKDGTELFGNFSPHSHFTDPNLPQFAWNGFIALGWYDQPEQGGTGDQIMDKNDAIWKRLRLWIDTHCYTERDTPCQSRPSELHTLESFGITAISIVYTYDPQK